VKKTANRERLEIHSTFRPNIVNRSDRQEDVGEDIDIKLELSSDITFKNVTALNWPIVVLTIQVRRKKGFFDDVKDY
jgi:hypothetical protein